MAGTDGDGNEALLRRAQETAEGWEGFEPRFAGTGSDGRVLWTVVAKGALETQYGPAPWVRCDEWARRRRGQREEALRTMPRTQGTRGRTDPQPGGRGAARRRAAKHGAGRGEAAG